jgi:ATP-binding cassette subfamily F protein uup
MAAPPLLLLQNIALTLGATPLIEDAEFSVSPGERLALVGRNGSGKSTLLRIAAGEIEADKGKRFFQPDASLRYLPQEPDLSGHATVLSYVTDGLAPGDDPHRPRRLLEHLGLTGEEAPARLSGGEARRAALARGLAPRPDILLLDEPTNHLDLPAIAWLEEEIAAQRGALVVISHDRRFLSRLSRAVLWLDRGVTRRLDRGFDAFEAWREEVLEQEEREAHKLGRQIAREEHWLRYGVTARRKRNVRRLANLSALREARRSRVLPMGAVKMAAAEAERPGTLVIDAEDVGKTWGGRTVVRGVSTRILTGDRVGIIGPNGAGKTTLLNLLTGRLAPDSGRVRLGSGLAIASLEQMRDSLDPARSLADTLTEGRGDQVWVNGQPRHVIGYMKDFLFAPQQARSAVGSLSGGERGRLLLARAIAQPSNLLVLDEPTNDLDLETLDLLQEMLGEYSGTVLMVSHDRDVLDRVCTSVIASEGEGRWQDYAGGYSDMAAQRGEAPAPRAAERAARAEPAAPAAAPQPARPRRGFKERHALATLPATMERLSQEIAVLERWLSDPDLGLRDPKGLAARAAALSERQRALSAAEEEWLRLELLREEMEG